MAKRSCRRTTDENKIHEKAVKIRKMTDEQIVHYVEDRANKSYAEGYNKGKAESPKPVVTDSVKSAREFIEFLANTTIKGVGVVTVSKILKVAEENGYC